MKQCKIEGCEKPAWKRAWCTTHYTRWWKYKDPLHKKSAAPGETIAFLKKVVADPPKNCVLWPWSTKDGYGITNWEGRSRPAHRIALIFHTGIDPDDLNALHGPCHSRSCVNPAHLRWGTKKENAQDKRRDGTYLYGEKCPNAKLNSTSARAIFDDPRTPSEIARDFNVTPSTVWHIKVKKTWKHIHSTPGERQC